MEELALSGRGGDTVIAHLAEGDVVIPVEKITDTIKQDLDKMLRGEVGRYTVGHIHNVVNPRTGLREFNGYKGHREPFTVVKEIGSLWPIIAAIGWICFAGIWYVGSLNTTITTMQKEISTNDDRVQRLQEGQIKGSVDLARAVDERNQYIRDLVRQISTNTGKINGFEATINRYENRLELLEHAGVGKH